VALIHGIGDALAWSTDERSRERVKLKLADALRSTEALRVVLIGHSQGGSIATELGPWLRYEGREARLVTLGRGHGLLATMHSVLPRWSLAKSLVSWIVLLVFFCADNLNVRVDPSLHSGCGPLHTGLALPIRLPARGGDHNCPDARGPTVAAARYAGKGWGSGCNDGACLLVLPSRAPRAPAFRS
jgi:hypothetical protein